GALIAWVARDARVQREVVSAIEHAGGLVSYDSGRNDDPLLPGANRWAPEWLVGSIGHDYFEHVSIVVFERGCTDEELAQIGRLRSLVVLIIDQSSISDTGLEHLTGLANLSHLVISGTKVSDAGLKRLGRFTNLSVLDLSSTLITDDG